MRSVRPAASSRNGMGVMADFRASSFQQGPENRPHETQISRWAAAGHSAARERRHLRCPQCEDLPRGEFPREVPRDEQSWYEGQTGVSQMLKD
jgi:hypothetical protein